jgi:hypothetical protein
MSKLRFYAVNENYDISLLAAKEFNFEYLNISLHKKL